MSDRLERDLQPLIEQHMRARRPALLRLWSYYRNALEPAGSAGARHLAQAAGLPARLTAPSGDPLLDERARTREIVIENDIAWRIDAMVDFMFGRSIRITSLAPDEPTRRAIERTLDAIWESSGGIALLQDIALLGHVYGFVDLAIRLDEPALALAASAGDASPAPHVRIEAIDPLRAIPVLNAHDYRDLEAYIIHVPREESPAPRRGFLRRPPAAHPAITEIITPASRRVLIDGRTVAHEPSRLLAGVLPVVHIQNRSQPFRYEGLGEVEPLIPLQDELNTRLSDRASRVTLQSFKMYLAKGLDGFDRIPVGPGQIWSTDNMDATVQAFGGDADSPSESRHVEEIREALDKASGVPPVASGVVRAKIGNLSSANALRVTLMGLLSRTQRKRITYGQGIARACDLILRALHNARILRSDPDDRAIRVQWPDPIPIDLSDEIAAARSKLDLGVPRELVLAELGYSSTDTGLN